MLIQPFIYRKEKYRLAEALGRQERLWRTKLASRAEQEELERPKWRRKQKHRKTAVGK